jgi:O-antigen/teichoic acid export membrane protein
MTEHQASYRQIMKATSIFGGVQLIQIIIQVIRSKFVAVLLGPTGMGISGLLTATLELISYLSNFGLRTSAVKNISAANATGNQHYIAVVVVILKRLAWITGIIGSLVTLIFSSWLSHITFGNHNYTFAFIWMSVTLLFNQLTTGQLVLLQGIRKLDYLAKANVAGSALGLIFTVPLYYKWGIDGIVPGIIITSLIALVISIYFSRKVKLETVSVTKDIAFSEGKNMLFMGFLISMSGLATIGASYLIRIFIGYKGGLEQVGLYNAGFTIINTYVGLIFTAMATDFYPRLSAVSDDNKKCKDIINQQAEIAILILAPFLIVFLVFVNWVVLILYSTKFIAVNVMINWAAIGMVFKAPSWAIAFILLAKGSKKVFFFNELIANLYILGLNIVGYYYMGLEGIGISFVIGYLIYLIQVFLVSKYMFDYSFEKSFIKIFIIQFSLAVAGFLSTRYLNFPYNYLLGLTLILVSSFYSLNELDKRLGIKSIIENLKYRLLK